MYTVDFIVIKILTKIQYSSTVYLFLKTVLNVRLYIQKSTNFRKMARKEGGYLEQKTVKRTHLYKEYFAELEQALVLY